MALLVGKRRAARKRLQMQKYFICDIPRSCRPTERLHPKQRVWLQRFAVIEADYNSCQISIAVFPGGGVSFRISGADSCFATRVKGEKGPILLAALVIGFSIGRTGSEEEQGQQDGAVYRFCCLAVHSITTRPQMSCPGMSQNDQSREL